MSPVTCNLSPITGHLSHVTWQPFYTASAAMKVPVYVEIAAEGSLVNDWLKNIYIYLFII